MARRLLFRRLRQGDFQNSLLESCFYILRIDSPGHADRALEDTLRPLHDPPFLVGLLGLGFAFGVDSQNVVLQCDDRVFFFDPRKVGGDVYFGIGISDVDPKPECAVTVAGPWTP